MASCMYSWSPRPPHARSLNRHGGWGARHVAFQLCCPATDRSRHSTFDPIRPNKWTFRNHTEGTTATKELTQQSISDIPNQSDHSSHTNLMRLW